MATVKADITTNPRVGPGSKLFPSAPNDIQSFVPNDNAFPDTPDIDRFVPGEAGEFDEYIAGKPTPDTPADFKERIVARVREDREGSKPLAPPLDPA